MTSPSPEFLDKLRNLERHLQSNIKGQDHLLPRVCSVLHRGELGLAHPGRPKGSMLYVGPTGVGKTELTICFSDYLFGRGHFHRFDMSEYQLQSSIELLLGANSSEIGILGRAVKKSPKGTLLFDEIEKAHVLVLDLFLQIVDAARITLANGETLDLSKFYIIFTSNIGAAEAMRMENSAFTTIERTVLRRVDQTLRPEMVARINEKLVFKRLTYSVQREICELMIDREVTRLAALEHPLSVTDSMTEQIVRDGYHRTAGARPMRNTVDRVLQDTVVANVLR